MSRIDDVVNNWLLVEEALANAHVVRHPTRLVDFVKHFFGMAYPDPTNGRWPIHFGTVLH